MCAVAGIGYTTALDLARRNARIILACRRLQAGETAAQKIRQETGNSNITAKYLDTSSLRSVRQFAEEINQEEKKLHILINNAGISGNKSIPKL